VLVLILIAAIVIIAFVVFLAIGRGGGMSAERGDYLSLDLGPVSATDVALLRPPTGVWGYNMQATDEAMELIADSIRERDVRIVALEQLVTDLGRDHAPMAPLGGPYTGARHRRSLGDTAESEEVRAPGDTGRAPRDAGQRGSAGLTFGAPTPDSVRLPFDLSRTGGDVSVPPEQSHD
jgi:hypothetical protein